MCLRAKHGHWIMRVDTETAAGHCCGLQTQRGIRTKRSRLNMREGGVPTGLHMFGVIRGKESTAVEVWLSNKAAVIQRGRNMSKWTDSSSLLVCRGLRCSWSVGKVLLLLSNLSLLSFQLSNFHLYCHLTINSSTLGGLTYSLECFLQLNMCQEFTDFCICMYVFGCKLSVFRLCDSDFGITPVDDITIGITCTVINLLL
jgi:hypothetical protein